MFFLQNFIIKESLPLKEVEKEGIFYLMWSLVVASGYNSAKLALSAACERVFSAAGLIFTAKRTHI